MTINDELLPLIRKLDTTAPALARCDRYWSGRQQAAFLSAKSRAALGGRLDNTGVNFCRLAIRSRVERLTLTGFRVGGSESGPDSAIWDIWRATGMVEGSSQAMTDALLYGRSFVSVWADSAGNPTVTVESPTQLACEYHPVTREVTRAFKRWVDPLQQKGFGVLYERDRIRLLTADARAGDPAALSATSWTVTDEIPNPLGVVPIVPIVNRGRVLEVDGFSEIEDLTGLVDGLAKLSADALVTSEYFARPRRWVTGLEIVEDDDGNVVNPFASEEDRVWQSESAETKFGQFDAAGVGGYTELISSITSQVGAVSGLPPHYLGIAGDQPASADAIRSAEASLVARCLELQTIFGRAWAEVVRLIIAARDGVDPRSIKVDAIWSDPSTRTPAQTIDGASKLVGIGVPLTTVAEEVLGWSPAQIARLRTAIRQAAFDAAPLSALAPPPPEPKTAEPKTPPEVEP